MVTYNNIIELFENIANAHLQVKSFGVGEVWAVDARPEDAQRMPKVWLIPGETTVEELVSNYQLTLLCFDLVQKDETNLEEVLSDTQLILFDIVKVLRAYPNEWFQIVGEPRLNPFTERFGEDVSGWRMDMTLQVDFNNSDCDMPMTSFVFPGSGEADPGGGGDSGACCEGNPNEVAVYGADGILTSIAGGTAGQVLTDDGSGNYSFTTVSGGNALQIGNLVVSGTPTEVLYIDNAGNLFSDGDFTRDSVTNALRLTSNVLQAGFESGLILGIGAPEVKLHHRDFVNGIGSLINLESNKVQIGALDTPGLQLAAFITDLGLGISGFDYLDATANTGGEMGVFNGTGTFGSYKFNLSGNLANSFAALADGFFVGSDINNIGDQFIAVNVTNSTYQFGDISGGMAGMGINVSDLNQVVEIGNIYGAGGNATALRVNDQAQVVTAYTNVNDVLIHVGDPAAAKFTALGYQAGNVAVSGFGNVLIGNSAGTGITSGEFNTIIGTNSATVDLTINDHNTVIGHGIFVGPNAAGSVAIGSGTLINFPGQFVAGSDTAPITDYVFYRGLESASAHLENLVFRKSHAVGTNVTTTQWDFNCGKSTGNKEGGTLTFSVSPAGVSGSASNNVQEVFRLNYGEAVFNQRVWTGMGYATAANDMVCDYVLGRSNTITVAGNTAINGIDAAWSSPQPIVLLFTGSPTLNHNTACGLGFRPLILNGSAPFNATPGSTITFISDGFFFYQTARSQP